MPDTPHIPYKRSKFSTRLYADRLYTQGHLWLWNQDEDRWRIGFAKFALRMLGDPVEFELEVKEGEQVETGQVVGWLEGFKAVSDVYTPMAGTFRGSNPELDENIDLLKSRSHERSWLFELKGTPDDACLDAEGYAGFLDETIDRMVGKES